jgi:hypothetical protein
MKSNLYAAVLALALLPAPAHAFSHVVKPGETLAQIAFRVYGDTSKEKLLAGANALDLCGGSAIVPGMRLEVPAPAHHRVGAGETWGDLALVWLGDKSRGDVLARANGALPWVQPEAGLEIEIPAVVGHVGAEGESSTSLAARYWGDGNRGWELNAFNGRSEAPIHRGEIILVPMANLALTEAGLAEARSSLGLSRSEVSLAGMTAQRHADAELPLVSADLRSGHYVDVIARGNRVLGSGDLTPKVLVTLYRALLEAYVAVGATDEARTACVSLRGVDKALRFDPVTTSPKIRAACPKE